MKVRRAKIEDVNQLYNLINKTKEVHLSENIYSKDLIKKILKNKTVYAIVAEENKKILGLLTAALWKSVGTSYWDMVIVDKNIRGKGIASKLYNSYVDYLKRNKIFYLWGLVKHDNYNIQKIMSKFKLKKQELCYYYDRELK